MASKNTDFRTSGFMKVLLPGIVLQSVLMGGGYATGREIIEYGGKFGAIGWVSGVFTFLTFAVIAVLTFELARIYRIYDYKSILKQIIGKAWPIYDFLYVILLFLIISIMASATGEILQQTIGLNYMVGVVILIVIVAFLNFFGSAFIAKFETYGTIALYAAYIIFTIMVITANKDNISAVFANSDTSFVEGATIPLAMWTGIIYSSYNLSAIPAGLFTLRAQTKRSEAVISGIIGALLMTVPWFLTYFAVMGYYPDENIIGASVPWLVMLQSVSDSPIPVLVFGVVAGWTLIETATGMIHALLERLDHSMEESNKEPLSPKMRGLITAGILIVAILFSKIGIINLISMGYSAIAYGFILVYLLPLLTVGLYKVIKNGEVPKKN
ncbi:hypothetical protein H9X85_06365 [Anaerotignum lactatifermentans]|uniref:Membrane protein YkvI n=1 Tax=Anaerotignum lactatifermentans TaxID=160404 RepID=A0ABS2G7Q0_9FIRM|nr:hypothetical protein [Anaerotignum lactatifermentans]MBM6829261.1 hypothetical protein [Anaerotignum lactatifermentans]MBM6877499.1 hypothetical protein [Anaerotignum lactatifermentans]MBM6950839.1 hypothetical protein [Anaerotignum lactatifermentans]